MRDRRLDILFEPLKSPNLIFKNRFFMAPMGTGFGIQRLTDYFVRRAEAEVALITTGAASVHYGGRTALGRGLWIERDDDIRKLIPMVRRVHRAGARIVIQLNHAGRYYFSRFLGGRAVAPSAVPSRYTNEIPRALSTEEADDLVVAFADAAVRAREAGFDGVEILGSSGYLISQFLSPVTNKREDKYGGDALQRAAFVLSVVRETRKRVGDGFNLCVKFDAEDGMEGGWTLWDSLVLAPKLVEAGADRLHIWAGWHESTRPMLPMSVPRGAFAHLAGEIRKTVSVPVSTLGRINDPYVAAEILRRGDADLIGLGRALLSDPDFVKKTMEGNTERIRRCIACCRCFDARMRAIRKGREGGIECTLNPELGKEGKRLIRPAEKKKRVLVVGAGPSGMEAARVALLRGHRVSLFDKEHVLGGMLLFAMMPPHKEELKNVSDFFRKELEMLGVDLHLNLSFTIREAEEAKPDLVVLATGSIPIVPDIPGIDMAHVVTAIDVLKGMVLVREYVVVIGGGMIGLETAEFLADRGKKVTVIEASEVLARDMGPSIRWGFLSRIRTKVRILAGAKILEINQGAVVISTKDRPPVEIPADSVVVAAGTLSRQELLGPLEELGIECIVTGSGRTPGLLGEAIHDGFRVGIGI